MSSTSYPWLTLASIGVASLLAAGLSWRARVKNLPPGPAKLPLIDNLLNMPSGFDWVKFHELSKQYNSDIIHLSALGYSIVILDTFEAAKELLDVRSGIYSSRPTTVMMNELSGLGHVLPAIPYGDRFRSSRRMFAKHFGFGSVKFNRPREVFYARRCLHQLLETPNDFLQHLQYLIGSISLSITYGLKARPSKDQNVEAADELVHTMTEIGAAGMYMVDIIPALKYLPKWFPGAAFQKQAEKCSNITRENLEQFYKVAEQAMETPEFTPSFVSENLREFDQTSDVQVLKDLALTVYLAAADTTRSALGTFVLAMVRYPEIQKQLQSELDGVLCGKLPEHDDVQNLPLLTAVFMEVLRWKPITPVGVPHLNTVDDVYNGNVIPQGSLVLANQWAMLQDPTTYPEPSEFRPERFLKNGQINESVRSPLDIAFGFGRRICPGRHIAQSTFTVVAASILSSFDLLMKKDGDGNPIRPDPEYHLSLACHPKDFPCDIVPRSQDAKDLIISWATLEGDNPP